MRNLLPQQPPSGEFDLPPPPPEDEYESPEPGPPPPPDKFSRINLPPPPPVDAAELPPVPPRVKRRPPLDQARETPVILNTRSQRVPESRDIDTPRPKPKQKPSLEIWSGINRNIQDSTLFKSQKIKNIANVGDAPPPVPNTNSRPPVKKLDQKNLDLFATKLGGNRERQLDKGNSTSDVVPVVQKLNSAFNVGRDSYQTFNGPRESVEEINIGDGTFPEITLRQRLSEEVIVPPPTPQRNRAKVKKQSSLMSYPTSAAARFNNSSPHHNMLSKARTMQTTTNLDALLEDGSYATLRSSWGERYRKQQVEAIDEEDDLSVDDGSINWLKPTNNGRPSSPSESGFQFVKPRMTSIRPNRARYDTEVFQWINKARTRPTSLIPFLEQRISEFEPNSNNLIISENERLVTHEGKAAVEEAIEFLEKQQPLAELKWNDLLRDACEDHVNECGPQGLYTHKLKDGTQPTDRVLRKMGEEISTAAESLKFNSNSAKGCILDFIIDDGVQSRGNRKNLFGNWDMTGCFTGHHSVSQTMTTVLFVQSASLSGGIVQRLIDQINADLVDPKDWAQKQQKVMYTGDEITITTIYKMRDGSENTVEVKRAVKDGNII